MITSINLKKKKQSNKPTFICEKFLYIAIPINSIYNIKLQGYSGDFSYFSHKSKENKHLALENPELFPSSLNYENIKNVT